METPELSISVGDLLGVPKVTLRGVMDGWHDQAVSGVLSAFRDQTSAAMVLDMANLTLAGAAGAASMIKVLRNLGPEISIHVIASGRISTLLRKAELGPGVRVYSNTDEITEYLSPAAENLTSRWLAKGSDDAELPLAA